MSVDEIQRIMNHLDNQDEKIVRIQNDIARVLVTVEGVPEIINKLNSQDTSIQLIKKDQKNCQAHCASIQEEKKNRSVNWGQVKTNIIIGALMLIIGSAFTAWVIIK